MRRHDHAHRCAHWVVITALFGAAACGDPEPSNNTSSPDQGVDMARGDMAADMGVDMATDMGASCQLQGDCPTNFICAANACVRAPSCEGLVQWSTCRGKIKELDPTLADRAICLDQKCRVACSADAHCGAGEACVDDGVCAPFTSDLDAPEPGGEARAALKAGVGEALMRYPIGLSMAGFGGRGTGDGRYVESLGPSHGQMQGLYARAVMLDNGERQLMIVRLPIIFPTSQLHEAVARYLQEKTGKNWRGSLLISGTHTHSGPARYYGLPTETLVPIGAFGTDDFHDEAFQWLVGATTEAVQHALDDAKPAKLGWKIVESFDTDDEVSSDRWGETPPFDDNRVLLIRVDDAQGEPRAVLFSLGTHGVFNDSDYYTSDSLGGMEHALEHRLGAKFGKTVPTMFFNQNGGTMSPRGDRHGHQGPHKFEQIGYRFVQKVWDDLDGLETKDDVALGGVTRRFPLSLDLLGYSEGEYVGLRGDLRYGGLQCDTGKGDDDPATHVDPTRIKCLLAVHEIVYNRPPSAFIRSQISAFEIDGLTLVTMPGELSMELGWQVLRDVSDTHQIDPFKIFTLGYAQDHHFYLTPTNLRGRKPPFPGITLPKAPDEYPDYAFSTLQGGYEGGFVPWGYRMGDFLIERALETVALLRGQPVELKVPTASPNQRSATGSATFPMDTTDAADAGKLTQDVPDRVERLEQVSFSWLGGDPGAEMPQAPRVVLERVENGASAPVMTPSKRVYDNRGNHFITRLRKTGEGKWEWVATWEELKAFPTGTYHFKIEGHYFDGTERKPYTVTTKDFQLAPTPIQVTGSFAEADRMLRGTLGYKPGERWKQTHTVEDPGLFTGNFRMRHPDVPTGSEAPVVAGEDINIANGVTATLSQNGAVVATIDQNIMRIYTNPENVAGRDGVPVTRFEIPLNSAASGTYDVEVKATDAHGNEGVWTTTVTIP